MNAEGEKKDVRRPMNSFLIFCNKYRGTIQRSNPSMDNRNVTKALGDLWANLGDEKKVYMNIAKQKKDAFMMANPGYRWHKEKIPNVPKKSGMKPARARGSKTRMNQPDLSAMIPCDQTVEVEQSSPRLGQHSNDIVRDRWDRVHNLSFIEPVVNGLILIGEQEKCENQSLSASFTPLQTSTPVSVKPVVAAAANIHQQPKSTFSSLIEVARKYYQELKQQCQFVQPSPQLYSSTPADSTLLQPAPDRVRGRRRPKPPPKKRAWSVTETDNALVDATVTSCHGDVVSKQNLLTQKSCSDSYCPNMEACKMILPRRTFSVTTDSPSTICSITTGTEESPRFSQTWKESEYSTQKSDSCDTYVRSPPLFDLNSQSRAPQSTLTYEPQSTLTYEPQSTLTYEPQKYQPVPDTCILDMSRKFVVPDSGRISADRQHWPDNNYFQQHLEPGMLDKKFGYKCTENLAPGAASTQIADKYSPDLKFDHTGGKYPRHPTQKQSLNELKPKNGIFPALSQDEKPLSAPPSLYTKATLASLLGKGRLVSLLSTNVVVDRQALSVPEVNDSAHKTLQKIENMVPAGDKQSYNKQSDSRKHGEQFLVTHKSGFVNENNFIHGRPCHLTEPQTAVLHLPLSQARTFSERKLKKKWEERMLVETRQECVRHCQTAVGHDSKDVTVELVRASANNVTFQDMSLLCVSDSEHSHQTDIFNMHQKQGLSIFPVEQKPILIQPQSLLDSKPSQAASLSASNSSRYSKLRQQLSQNQPLLKPDLPRLQSPFKIQPEQEASGKSYLSHSSSSSGHQCMGNLNKTKAGRDTDKLPTEVPHDRKVLDHVATYGKRFMDHILEQFYKTDLSEDKKTVKEDICEDRQTTKTDNPKEFPFDGNLSAPIVKSENEQKSEPVLAGLREVSVDKFQKDLVDYKMLTASSLVEKAIREFCDSSQRKDVCDSSQRKDVCDSSQRKDVCDSSQRKDVCDSSTKTETVTPSDDHDTDASHTTPEPDSLSNQTLLEISSEILESNGRNKQVYACANGEDSVQCQLTPVAVVSSNDPDIAHATIIQPIRKSRRANRGQKYQELIKEGIIQPSRERLASRNGDKHCKNHGSKEVCSQVETRKVQSTAVSSDVPRDGCAAASSPSADSNAEELSISRNVEVCAAALPVRLPRRNKRKSGHLEGDDNSALSHPHCDNNHSGYLKGGNNVPRKMSRRHRRVPSQSDDENSLPYPHCHDNQSSACSKSSNNFRMMTRCHRSAPSQLHLGNSSNSAIITTLPMLKVAVIGSHCPTGCSSLPQRNPAGDQIIGSQKRKARRHCIMRISAAREAIEDLDTTSSIERSALPVKKPRLSSESQILSVSASQEVSPSSLNTTMFQAQLLDGSSVGNAKGKEVSAEMPPNLRSVRGSCDQNKTEVTDITDRSVTAHSWQEADVPALSSSNVVVSANSCTSFSPLVTSTPIISSLSITSCRPIVSSLLITSSTPNLSVTKCRPIVSSLLIPSSTPNISISSSTAPVASSTPIISSASILNSVSMQSVVPLASSTPMVMPKEKASSFEFTKPDLSKKEQGKLSSGVEISNKKLQICTHETTKRPRQVIMSDAEIGQSCTKNRGTLGVSFDEERKAQMRTAACDSTVHLHLDVDVNCVEESKNKDEDTSLMSHVKSILECTYTHTESSPALRMTPLNLSAQSRPFYEAENISLYSGLYQDDSKQSCYDTTVMDVSSTTALLASHSESSLPVIEICECMESPALESSSLVSEVTFATKPDPAEALPVPPKTISLCHNHPSSSRFTYSQITASGNQVDRPFSSTFSSVTNQLSSAYSSPSTSNTVIS